MSKNMTRKGLAISAGFALVATGLAAMPAQAAITGLVSMTPTSGTSYVGVQGEGIKVKTVLEASNAAVLVQELSSNDVPREDFLRYLIENPDGAELVIDPPGSGVNFIVYKDDDTVEFGTVTRNAADGVPDVTVDTNIVTTKATKITVLAQDATADNSGDSNELKIDATQIDSDVEVSVTPWLDYQDYDNSADVPRGTANEETGTALENAGYIDTFEEVGNTETVTLVSEKNLTASTVLDQDIDQSSTDITANVTLGAGINMQQNASKVSVVFYKDGLPMDITDETAADGTDTPISVSANGSGARMSAGSYDSTDKNIQASTNYWVNDDDSDGDGNATNLPAGNYSAIAVWEGTDSSTDPDLFLGSASDVVALSDGLVEGVKGAYVKGEDSADVAYTNENASTADKFDVRAGVESVDFTVQVTAADDTNTPADADSLEDDYAAANVQVRAEFTASALDEDSAVTVNGATKTIADKGDKIIAYGRTDSKGQVTFTITNSGATKGDRIDVEVFAVDDTGAFVADDGNPAEENKGTFEWKSGTPALFSAVNEAVSGSTVNLAFSVVDNFSQPIDTTADGDLKVYMVALKDGVEDAAFFSETVDVVGGLATASAANFVTQGEAATVRAYLYREGFEDADANAVITGQSLKTVTVYNNVGAADLQVPAERTGEITYQDYRVGNSNLDTDLLDDSTLATTDRVALNGFVADSAGAGVAAAEVVVSSPGQLFEVGGVYTEDEVTVYTGTDGSYSVDVLSHTVNTDPGITVTSTVGTLSKDTIIKFNFPDGSGVTTNKLDGNNLTLDWELPSEIVMNTTYAVTVKLADKWGNPVRTLKDTNDALKLTSAGAVQFNGVSDDITKNFDKNGEVLVYMRSVKDIAGPGTITAELQASSYYKGGATPADTTLNIGEISDDVDGTEWDESVFENALSSTVLVTETATPSSTQKVNAGSFKGYVAVYALGYEGQRLSAKIGKDWVIVDPIVNNQSANLARVTDFTGAGVDIQVRIYIDRVLVDTIPLTTK